MVWLNSLLAHLVPALRLERQEPPYSLGRYEGHTVFASVSSFAHWTLYLYQPDAETLGIMIQDRNIRTVADGTLDRNGREAWLAHLREVTGGRSFGS